MSVKKVLLIRLDKIGDLICTLPVDQLLDSKQYDVTWIVQKGLGGVVDLGEEKRTYIELDKADVKTSLETLNKLIQQIKPDVAVSFQAPWWVNYSLWKNRIPLRAGVLSQWHSFLFLNKGLRQKRSLAEQHEFDYNKDLVLNTFLLSDSRRFHFFHMARPVVEDIEKVLNKTRLSEKTYQVIHPGMMGSALNWPEEKYIEYIDEQLAKNETIAITGTTTDEPYLQKLKSKFANPAQPNPNVRWLQSKLNLAELVIVLSKAKKVVAPSTGVAHLAASLSVETHVVFSPVQVHQPKRWAPRGPNVQIHLPDLNTPCPGKLFCIKQSCPNYNCMETIRVE